VLAARLEADVQRGAAGALARLGEGERFRVILSGARVMTAADDRAVPDHERPDQRIGARPAHPPGREIEGEAEKPAVLGGHVRGLSVPRRGGVLGPDQGGSEGVRVEVEKIVHPLSHADVADRDPELARDRQRHSAARRPVELREHEPRHGHGLGELAGLGETVLPRGRI
jgi:hypothetical protein